MNHEEFDELLDRRFCSIKYVLGKKKAEYATDDDRLSNFKTCAAFQQCTPERALWGQVSKHLVALFDFINLLEKGEMVSWDWWDEKIGDSINFLILLEALLKERIAEKESKPT